MSPRSGCTPHPTQSIAHAPSRVGVARCSALLSARRFVERAAVRTCARSTGLSGVPLPGRGWRGWPAGSGRRVGESVPCDRARPPARIEDGARRAGASIPSLRRVAVAPRFLSRRTPRCFVERAAIRTAARSTNLRELNDAQHWATPQRATPARPTPRRATSARATPRRATPARPTPRRANPARATPRRATPARGTSPGRCGQPPVRALRMRCTETGPLVGRCWAKRPSRSSSSIQRTVRSRSGAPSCSGRSPPAET